MFITRCQRRYMVIHITSYYGTNDRLPVLLESLVKQADDTGSYRIGLVYFNHMIFKTPKNPIRKLLVYQAIARRNYYDAHTDD